MIEVPDYVRERILSEPPEDCCVVPCTVPQIGEGYVEQARVVTVGINPHGPRSRLEYSPQGECELDMVGIQGVYNDKRQYFERRTYGYFTHLEKILNACDATYGGLYGRGKQHSSLAASLDVVQWCTDPLWGAVPADTREELLLDGRVFFENTLRRNPNIDLLLGNGRSAVEQLERSFGTRFHKWTEEGIGTHVYCGDLLGRQFVGWSTFLSNSRLNIDQRARLAKRVSELYGNGCN